MTHAGGRPSDYSPEMAERICRYIASNPIGLKKICALYDDVPHDSTIKEWVGKHSEFRAQYLEAKEAQALLIADALWEEVESIAPITEEINLFNAKFRFHQWHLSKLAPKQFGDKKEIKQDMNLSVHEQDLAHLK